MSPLEDLISIFTQISLSHHDSVAKHDLILDHDLSPQLNYLTHNKFTSFSSQANIDKLTWFPESGIPTPQLISFITSPTPLVFLITLQSDQSFSKLNILKSLLNNSSLFGTEREIHLVVHHATLDKSIETYLSNLGILGDLSSFNVWSSLLTVQLSTDPEIISLEYNNDSAFKHLYLDQSPLPLEMLAKLLLELHITSHYRLRVTNLFLKGDLAQHFWSIYQRFLSAHLQTLSDLQRKNIEDIDETIFMDVHSFYNSATDLIALDRSNDLLACLLPQLSYAGLCNDHFNIESQLSSIDLPVPNETAQSFQLYDSADKIYNSIKYLNFSHVGPILNSNAKSLQQEFDRRKQLKDIDEMKLFVNELSSLKQLQANVTKHTNIAAKILSTFNNSIDTTTKIPFLDEMEDPTNDIRQFSINSYHAQLVELQQDILSNQLTISQIFSKLSLLLHSSEEVQIFDIFKTLIITSITKQGFRESDFLTLYNELIFKYGIENVLPILLNLQKHSIIQLHSANNQQLSSFLKLSNTNEAPQPASKSQAIANFQALTKTFNLMPLHDENNMEQKQSDHKSIEDYHDADFAYPGYVPIFTRLIESIYSRSFLNPEFNSPSAATSQSTMSRAIKYGWNNLDAISSGHLASTTTQKFLVPDSKRKLFNSIIPPKLNDLQSHGTIIICAIGGITWSEIATIKYVLEINPLTKHKKVVILTTGIITSNQVIKAFTTPV